MLARFEDWPQRLDAAINAARNTPFGYGPGQNHCCLFAGDCVRAMTGTDVMAWFRGRYKDERGAYVALRRFAGAGLESAVEKIALEFGISEVPVTHAQRGDWVIHHRVDAEDHGAGICIGTRFVTVTAPSGLAFMPMADALRAWRI